MSKLGRPLAVVSVTAVCDGRGQHEARLITDGTRALGYLLDATSTDLGPASVALGRFTTGGPGGVEWSCRGDDGECTGYLYASTDRDDGWTSDPEAIDALVQYGVKVER